MTDPYFHHDIVVERLVRDWLKHGKLIISYDFDDTVFDCHGSGHTYEMVTELLLICKNIGALFIVNTCRGSEDYDFIKKYLDEKGLPYDKINENFDFAKVTGTKIYANIMLDDKAGLAAAVYALKDAAMEVTKIRMKNDPN